MAERADGAPRGIAGPLTFAATALVVVGGMALSPDLRWLASGAFRQLTWGAVLATVPGQLAALLLCAAALHVLKPGVSFGASLLSRVLRDAGGNLLVLFPGLGELIGARALVLAGGSTQAAVAASALDVAAEALAQIPFVCLALAVLPHLPARTPDIGGATALSAIGLGAAAAGCITVWWASRRWRTGFPALRRRWADVAGEWRRRRRLVPAAIAIHLTAWAMTGLQVWWAARALGAPLRLVDAVVLESAGFAVRAILFFVPAGLGAQEAGFVLAGLALGMRQDQALALSLVLRSRDLLFGAPVLLLWPAFEWRGRRMRPGAAATSVGETATIARRDAVVNTLNVPQAPARHS